MADKNVPAQSPTRSDDQILPFAAWVPLEKATLFWIFKRSKRTQSFRSLWISRKTLTSSGHSLLQLLFQLSIFNSSGIHLQITPIDQAHQFVSPSSSDAIMDIMNQLGYTEAQIPSSLDALSPTKKGKKDKPHVIPYCRFIKIIICYLGRIHNIHQRSASPFHLTKEDFKLGNIKFVPKGEINEVFGMPIPDELISNNIRNAPYYNAYLEMVAKHDQKVTTKKEGNKKATKATKERPSKASANKPPKPKPTKEKSTKTTLPQPMGKGKIIKVRKAKSKFQLVDEPDEEPAHSEPEPKLVHQGKGKAIATEEKATQSLLTLHTSKRRGTMDQFVLQRQTLVTKEASTRPSAQAQDDISVNIVRDSPSLANAKTETGVASKKTNSDPSRTLESQHLPEQEVMDEDQAGLDPKESHGALAGPDPKPTHDEFMAGLYPKVQESLKFLADEHVMLEEPISSTRTLSSMKNLEDAFPIGDQFINDKSTKYEPKKPNVEVEVVSMVTVLIYQASSLVPPLSTPILVIDLSPPKPASLTTQAPVFTATTATTTIPLPHPVQQQSSTKLELAKRRDEFLVKKDKSRKRRRDDQDPPPPLSESDLSTRRRQDTSTSGSSQPQAPQQPVEDLPMPKTANISDSEDTDIANLPNTKQRPEWFKPIPDDDRPTTLEPDWVIPTSHILDVANNWVNALASTYKALIENSLLAKTRDMRTFMH
nr:hypothetical protein [Tanacetum cinerariifolium]